MPSHIVDVSIGEVFMLLDTLDQTQRQTVFFFGGGDGVFFFQFQCFVCLVNVHIARQLRFKVIHI